jgi:hypothetical protein
LSNDGCSAACGIDVGFDGAALGNWLSGATGAAFAE